LWNAARSLTAAPPGNRAVRVAIEVVDPLGLGEFVGLAEAWVIRGDHVEPSRQPGVKFRPRPRAARGVQEQNRLAGAVA